MSQQTFIKHYSESVIVAIALAKSAGVSQGQIDLYVLAARRQTNGAWF